MKILCSSDWHLRHKAPEGRTDDFFETQKDKVDQLLRIADEHDCMAILQAGDMFDSAEGSNAVLAHYIGTFLDCTVPIYCCQGQHDVYMRNRSTGRTALDVAAAAGVVTVLGPEPTSWNPNDKDEMEISVYGASWGEDIPPLIGTADTNVLVAHAPVYSEPVYPGHEPVGPAEYAKRCKDYDLVLLGDAHTGFFYDDEATGCLVVSTGCLVRLTRAKRDLAHKPHVLIYNTETKGIERIDLDVKPTEEVFDLSGETVDATADMKSVAELVDSLRRDRTERSSFEQRLEVLLASGEVSEFAADFLKNALAETGETE